ncbi:putative acetyltransferase [Marmoricola sp. URHA0025 HA25]
MQIAIDDPMRPDVVSLLAEHLADMHATSPAESVHALDVAGLLSPDITFWTVRRDGVLLGSGALKELDTGHGEVKSMRTTTAARGSGVATAMLRHLLETATGRGYTRVSLETGSQEFFEPARRLYARHGFTPCGPFGDYVDDPHSAFFTLAL